MSIEVTVDSNFEQALKSFGAKVKKSGLLKELKLRQSYEKPSEKRRRERADNLRRAKRREVAIEKSREFFKSEKRKTQQMYQRERRAESLRQSAALEGKEVA